MRRGQRTPDAGRVQIPPIESHDRPRWSVMIPTYNCDEFLTAALESVLSQIEPDMQVEVVDDRSTDGDPEAIVLRIGEGRVSFHQQPVNVGHTRNFNTCLRRARGELVHLLHGDDVVQEGFYRLMGEHFDTWSEAGGAICRHAIIDEHGVQRAVGPLLQTDPGPIDDWLPTIAAGQLVQPPAVVVRRSVYEAIGGFNEAVQRYGEDWEMWVRVAAATTVVYEPAPLASYRKRSTGSLSDARRARANMADMRFVMRANRSTMDAAGVREIEAIDRQARTSLSDALLRRSARQVRATPPKIPLPMASEAVRTRPAPKVFVRSVLVVARGIVARVLVARGGSHAPRLLDAVRGWCRRLTPPPATTRRTSPLDVLDDAPPGVSEALTGARVRPLPPSTPPKDHLMYEVDDDRILHVYGSPAPRITRSLPEHRLIDELHLPGVPALDLVETAPDRVWIVEARVPGTPPSVGHVSCWFPAAARFLVDVAGPAGPPLRRTEFWSAHESQAVAIAPRPLRRDVERAWDMVGDLPARVVHGDVQPKNLVVHDGGFGLVDWEGVWRFGLPGLDLVFLALMAAPRRPDALVLETLAGGRDMPDRPVLDALADLDITFEHVRPALLAMLSTWSLGEYRRVSRTPSHRHQPTPFRALLDELGQTIAGG